VLGAHGADLRFVGQGGGEGAGDAQGVEMAGGTRDGAVGGALGGGGGEGEVVPDLAGEAHALPRVGLFRRRSGLGSGCCGRRRSRARREEIGDGVVEPMWVHGVPGA